MREDYIESNDCEARLYSAADSSTGLRTGANVFGRGISQMEHIPQPIFVLSPPRSFSSIACAMIGQHPQLYGLPETNLFGAESLVEWQAQCSRASHTMHHGVLRTVAELYFGGQTERTITQAEGWLRRRLHFSTGYLLEQFSKRLHPKRLVDKSPSLVYSPEAMRRVVSMFPRAAFIHLVRHPGGQGASVLKRININQRLRSVPEWLIELASFPVDLQRERLDGRLDPQGGWYALNRNICDFLAMLPADQWIRIQGEALLQCPDRVLGDICSWLQVRTDAEAIEQMKHPEASPFSRMGPPGAEFGNDILFLHDPRLRSRRAELHSLEGPLSWRADGAGFSPFVKDLAIKCGYK